MEKFGSGMEKSRIRDPESGKTSRIRNTADLQGKFYLCLQPVHKELLNVHAHKLEYVLVGEPPLQGAVLSNRIPNNIGICQRT